MYFNIAKKLNLDLYRIRWVMVVNGLGLGLLCCRSQYECYMCKCYITVIKDVSTQLTTST